MKQLGRVILGALVVLLGLAGLAGLVPAAHAQEPPTESSGIEGQPGQTYTHSWGLGPAGSTDPSEPGNRQNLTYDAAPGSTIDDAVTLYNYGDVQLDFRVYATDAFNTDDGGFNILPGDAAPTDAGAWVEVAQENLTVPPKTAVTIPITITIPVDARPGDHVGGVVASSPAPGVTQGGDTVSLDRRTGTRLYVRVAGPLEPALVIRDVTTSYHASLNPFGGSADVSYVVENVGNVRSGGSATAKVSGPLGLGEVTSPASDVGEILPGQSVTRTVTLDGVPAAVMATATVELTPQAVEGDLQAAEASSASSSAFAPPITLLALLLVAMLIFVAVARYRRHRPDAGDGRGTPPDVPQGPPALGEPVGAGRSR